MQCDQLLAFIDKPFYVAVIIVMNSSHAGVFSSVSRHKF
jgi:hypothetical protein